MLCANVGNTKKKSRKNWLAVISVSLGLIAAAGACASAWYFAAACYAQSERCSGYADSINENRGLNIQSDDMRQSCGSNNKIRC